MKMGKEEIFQGIGIKKFRAAFLSVILISAAFVGMVGILMNMVVNVEADQGGPDAYGYIWINNTAPPPLATYNWVEISNIPGTNTSISPKDDQATFPIGFPFTFYGNTYNNVNIYSHGYINFGPLDLVYNNVQIPDVTVPNDMIAAYWDDLYWHDETWGIYNATFGVAPNRMYVVQWNVTNNLGERLNFEIILHETSNNITMQYMDMDWDGSSATVGIENSGGTIGLEHSYDAAGSVYNGLAIVYLYVPPPYRVSLSPDFQEDYGFPTSDVDYILTVNNSGTSDDTYDLTSITGWTVTFRDIGDTMDITSITLTAGGNADFIARVSVSGGALPGDIDLATLNASSQNDSTVYDTAQVQTQVPYNVNWLDGFEGGWDGWTAEIINPGSAPTNWEIGDPLFTGPGTAYNGTNCSGTNIIDVYYPDADICLVTPYVQLGSSPQMLSFYHWYNMNTMDNDGGFVEISVNGGPWNQIWPIVGYPSTGGFMGGYLTDGYSGDSAGWLYDEFDLSAYANQVVQVRFHFAASPWWGFQWGWYLDDVYMGPPPPYRVELTPDYQISFGNPGTDVDFILTVENTGTSDDTYNLNAITLWPVTFRDIGDTMDITTISVAAGNSEDFIVRVSVPPFVSPGDVNIALIMATSQNDSSVGDDALVETNVPISPPWFDDMESGPGPWQNWSNGGGTEWQLGDPIPWPWGPPGAYSPNNCWGTNIVANYTWSSEATLTTTYVDLSWAATAYLTFWHWYDINGGMNDAGWVEVSDDYGGSWTTIFPVGGYPDLDGMTGLPCYAGMTPTWVQAYFDLSAYSGDVILIQFHFRDAFFDGVERSGWYVDDVSVYASVYAVDILPDSVGFGNPGDTVQYTLTVTNTGFSDDSFALSVSGNIWTTTIYESTGTFVITNTGFLAAGNSVDIVVKVDIPPFALPGSYDIARITATSDNDTVISDSVQVDTNVPIMPTWFDDMESGVGPWRTWDNGAFTIWQLGDPSPFPPGPGMAYSGTNCWGTNIVADYTTGGEATLTTPYINLSLAADANLTFWHWYNINGGMNDGGWVEVSDDYGMSWTRIDPVGGYPDFDAFGIPCYAGASVGWVQAQFNLTAYTGSMIVIRFHFRDFPFDGVELSGWYVDDINVSAIYVPYGVNLVPDTNFDFGLNGTMVLYLMTATNIGTIGSDTFDLTANGILGWPVTFYDLGMNPITSLGPLATGVSQDFYAGVNIPVAALPMTLETTWVTATSQNDPSINPANDTSTLLTEVLAQILLVDDDGGIDTEINFTAALTAGGYYYNLWDYSTYGPPELSDLQEHEIVIWCTGNTYDDTIDGTLSSTDRANLGNYLDGGGRLYLSSQFAGIDATNAFGGVENWLPWYQTYLHSNYVNLLGFGAPSVLNGISNDPISDGLAFNIHQGDYNLNLWGFWTDNTPVNMGVTFFTEPSPGNVATRADTGTYRMVYTAFDFADVDGAANRALLMDRILNWLQFGDLPYVSDTVPMNNEINVDIIQNIVVIYSESMNTSVTPSLLQVGGPDPGGWLFAGWSTTNVANDTATWTHNDWAPGQAVNMSVSGGEDLEGNTASGYLWNFTVIAVANPWADATGPVSSGNNNPSPTITYNYGNSPINVQIYWSNDGGSSWNMWGTDNTVDGSWPAGSPLPASGTYYWSARAMGGPSEPIPSGPGDIEAGPYVLDIDAPVISSTIPLDGASSVAIDQNIVVVYSESMDSGVIPTLSQVGGPDPGGWVFVGWSTTNIVNDTATWTHNNWALGQDVNMSVSGGQDLVGNPASGYLWNFSIIAAVNPWANATGPISALTNDATPTITYNFGNGPTSVEIYWSSNGGATWNLWGTDATVDGSWPAASPLPASGTYVWSARAIGAPSEPIPSGPGDIEAFSYILDIDAPTIISTTPTDGATGVSTVAGTYVIEFSEPMDTVVTPLSDLPIIGWIWDSSGLWLNGTYTVLNPGTTYNVNLTGRGFQDLATNALTGDMDKNFTTVATPGPWAVATGPISVLTNNPSPTIAYSFGNGPTSVEIYWSDDGGTTWNLWGTDATVDGSWPAGSPLPASGTYAWSTRAIGAPNESVPSGPGDVEASSYVLDIDAPMISSTIPLDGASSVAIDQNIVVVYSESMDSGVIPTLSQVGGPNPGGWVFVGWSTTNVVNDTATWTHNNWALGQDVNMSVSGGQDEAGNPAFGYLWNFTIIAVANPWANATGPISALTNNATPTITYNFGNGPTSVEIYWSDDGGTSWNLWGTDASVDGSWPAVSLLPASGTYVWSARAIGAPSEPVPSGPGDIEAGSYVLDIDAPIIISTTPTDGAIDVSIFAGTYVIEFSEPMNLTGSPLSNLPGLVWNWDASGLWFNGTYTILMPSTTYYVDLFLGGFQDLAGNALIGDTYKDFTTQPPDTIPPTVVSGTPTGTGVSIGANIVIVFNETMNTTSVESAFSYTDGTTTWDISDGTVNWNEPTNTTMTFNPTANFAYFRSYTVTIDSDIAKDFSGNFLDGNKNGTSEGSPIDDYSWSFTTQPIPDSTPPTSSVGPLDPYKTSLTFNVYWNASDPSGILYVELFYTTDGGATWHQFGTTFILSPISFTASDDGEYGFYVIATDNSPLQNRETPPVDGVTTPDQTTIVDTTEPTVDAGSDVTTNSEITQNASASDVGSGIATYEWTMVSGPGTITFGNSDAEDTTVSADTAGTYVIRLTVTDNAGNSDYDEFTLIWDTTPPMISTATPTGTDVPITTTISIIFNETMDHATVQNAFNFTDGITVWTISNGSVSWSANTMTFTPTVDLSYGRSYTVNIGTGAQDRAGNGLASVYSWSFTTTQAPDTTSPTVTSVSLEGDDVKVTNTMTITFSEAMDHDSVEDAISISPDVEIQNFTWVGNTLTITFTSDLEPGTEYNVTISTGAEDVAGNSLEEPHTWQFTTKEEEEEFPALALLLIILVIIIVIILLLFLMRKRKPEEFPPGALPEEIEGEGEGLEERPPEELGEEAGGMEGEEIAEEPKEEFGGTTEEKVEGEVEEKVSEEKPEEGSSETPEEKF